MFGNVDFGQPNIPSELAYIGRQKRLTKFSNCEENSKESLCIKTTLNPVCCGEDGGCDEGGEEVTELNF